MSIAELTPLLTNGPAVGLVLWVAVAVFRGNLIPGSVHDRALEEANKRAETWKQVAETYKNSLEKKDEVVPAQIASARTVQKMAEALQTLTEAEEKP